MYPIISGCSVVQTNQAPSQDPFMTLFCLSLLTTFHQFVCLCCVLRFDYPTVIFFGQCTSCVCKSKTANGFLAFCSVTDGLSGLSMLNGLDMAILEEDGAPSQLLYCFYGFFCQIMCNTSHLGAIRRIVHNWRSSLVFVTISRELGTSPTYIQIGSSRDAFFHADVQA